MKRSLRCRLPVNLCIGLCLTWTSSCSPGVKELSEETSDRFAVMLDGMQRLPRVYEGTAPLARMPLAVGQWSEYLLVDGDSEPGRMRLEVVGRQGGGFWISKTVESSSRKQSARFLVRTLRDAVAWKAAAPAVEDGSGSEPAAPVPPDGDGRDYPRIEMAGGPPAREVPREVDRSTRFLMENIRLEVSADRTLTIAVPAGTFENSVKRRLGVECEEEPVVLHEWLSSDVPISSVVKAETEDGTYRQVLLDFSAGKAK